MSKEEIFAVVIRSEVGGTKTEANQFAFVTLRKGADRKRIFAQLDGCSVFGGGKYLRVL